MNKTNKTQKEPKGDKSIRLEPYLLIAETGARLLAGYFIATAYDNKLGLALAGYFIATGAGTIVYQCIKRG